MNINFETIGKSNVIIGFSDRTNLWYLRWLARGYRHCFALIEQENGWVLYDPLSNRSVIRFYNEMTRQVLIDWYIKNGYRVIETEIDAKLPCKVAPLLPYTCVEAIKRLLGIHRWFLLTPQQLFLHLNEQNKYKLQERRAHNEQKKENKSTQTELN